MSTLPTAVGSNSHPVISPQLTPPPLSNPPFTTEEVDVDKLASTVEDPPLGHLALFKSVFGIGVSLARYIVDDPLWPILAAAGLPSSFCVRSKKPGSCSVVPHLAHCSNCDDKKPCILGQLARFHYFAHFWKYMEIPANALDFPSSQSNGGSSPIRLCKTWVRIGLKHARSRLELEGSYGNRDRGQE
ncbi:hypothetical protein F5876DRAFT_70562 [Lentinula aff. lateritia]|uniref:Uncharacterized protein n=1 Tax=Lentinula aff. lateritia TaxID=2804960 RepID=A0ACC1TIM1_9AGAR|nr:hypothetical protein F5876DRAFT_70562 [Lentinula aff. lateritia]